MRKAKALVARAIAALVPVKSLRCSLRRKLLARWCKNPGARVFVDGTANVIDIANSDNPCLSVAVFGDNNTVQIDTTGNFNATILIGATDCHVSGCKVSIGEDTTSNGASIMLMESGSSVAVGRDCMLSSDINILCSDTHSIYDANGKLLNFGRSVEIGDHVWIGQYSKILKNVRIGDRTVVGMGSVVASSFEEAGCIIAGVPARVVKRDVNWDRCRPQQFNESSFAHKV